MIKDLIRQSLPKGALSAGKEGLTCHNSGVLSLEFGLRSGKI